MTNKQTDEVIKEFRKKFELHDLGKDEFTLCCNNDDGTCDGGISILKESQGEAERHLKNVEQFILTAIQEAEERVVKRVEKVGYKCNLDHHRQYPDECCAYQTTENILSKLK